MLKIAILRLVHKKGRWGKNQSASQKVLPWTTTWTSLEATTPGKSDELAVHVKDDAIDFKAVVIVCTVSQCSPIADKPEVLVVALLSLTLHWSVGCGWPVPLQVRVTCEPLTWVDGYTKALTIVGGTAVEVTHKWLRRGEGATLLFVLDKAFSWYRLSLNRYVFYLSTLKLISYQIYLQNFPKKFPSNALILTDGWVGASFLCLTKLLLSRR